MKTLVFAGLLLAAGGSRVKLVPIAPGHARNTINTTIFSQPVASYQDTQYVAFYDAEGRVVLARRRLGSDEWEVRRTPYSGNIKDAHNGIALGIDGNGILHMSWDHHRHPLRYVRSLRPGSLDLTEKLPMTGTTEAGVTYPEFFRLPGGDLLFLYRDGGSGRGNTILKRYDHRAGAWRPVQEPLIHGEGARNAYTNRLLIGRDGVWHLSWVWRELGDASTNHDICYAKSDDEGRTWKKSGGEVYRLPITVANAEVVHPVPLKSDLINTTTMALDSRGRPLIATWWRPKGMDGPQYHLIWFDGLRWQVERIGRRNAPFSLSGGGTRSILLSRPLVLTGARDEVYVIFRAEDRGNRVSLARSRDRRNWRFEDLTTDPLDRWEPTHDRDLWDSRRILHLFHQRVGQQDGEKWADLPPQMVSVLEWQP